MGLVEEYFPLTGQITSFFLLSICIGDIICPMLVGQFVENHPSSFTIMMAACGLIVFVLYVAQVLVIRRYMTKRGSENETLVGQRKQNICNEAENGMYCISPKVVELALVA